MRDGKRMTHYKYMAQRYPKRSEKIALEHGVLFSLLDTLPNWNGPQSAPPEGMHLFYIGK